MDIWYEQLGFIENPFSIKPGAYDDEIFGYSNELKKVYSAMNKGGVWFVEGNFGVGKTSMLKQIINNFKGRKRVIYYSANRSEGGINFKQLLKNRNGFFQRWFGILPKNMILLLDEAHTINSHDATAIEKYMKSKNFKTIIFASDKVSDVQMTPWLKKKMGDKKILKLQPITENNAIKLVRNRVGDLKFLPNSIIKKVFAKSDKNPRKMLENLEDLCRYAMEIGAKKIAEAHLKKVLK
ncbi:hypothetical protein C0585_08070 [Candidatus Woesearchaeota archaeon]|nr:MAG: hypothetical protein C0585_08070 [Candidatus Woesearchaeota archaeon]